MGASVEKPKEIQDQNQNHANGVELNNHESKPQENGSEETMETIPSCCQGTKGVSCCRDVSSEVKQDEKACGKFSNWIAQREVLTAIGVAGAVAAVAVAYGIYRRSK